MHIPTPRSHFLRSLASVAVGNYLTIALSFVIGVIVARKLGAEGFGRLAVILMTVQVLGTVVFGWTLTGLIRFGAQEFSRVGSVAETFWARMTLIAPLLLVLIAGLALFQRQAALYFEIPVWAVWLALAYFVVSHLLTTMGSVFQAIEQMSRYAVVLCLDRTAVLVAVLLLPQRYARDPVAVLLCYAAGSMAVLGWALWQGRQVLAPVWPRRTALAALWRFSIPTLFSASVNVIGGQALVLAMLKTFHASGDLGVYSLATQIAGGLQQLMTVVALVLLPRVSVMVSRQEDEEVTMLIEHVLPYGAFAMALLFGAAALLAKPGIPLLFGPAFDSAVPLLIVLIVGSMALTFFSLFLPFLNAYGLTWTLTGISIATSVVNVAATLLLVPRYGAMGGAVATMLAAVTTAITTLLAARRRFGAETRGIASLSLPVAAVALALVLLDGGYSFVVALVALVAGTYMVAAMLKLFRKDDLVALDRIGIPHGFTGTLAKLFPRSSSPPLLPDGR